MADRLATGAQIALLQALLFCLLRAVKYREAPRRVAATRGDYGLALLCGAALGGLAGAPGAALAALTLVLAFWLLWLDAALYRVFTFELGAGGVAGVVLSNLYRETVKMQSARRFLRTHRAFAALPAMALLAHLLPLLAHGSLVRVGLLAALGAYLWGALSRAPSKVPDRREVWAGLLACTLWEALRRSAASTAPLAVLGVAPWAALLLAALRRPAWPGGRALVRDFLWSRRPAVPAGFQPRPEHRALLSLRPAPPRPSDQYGALGGASVVLLTFESLGAAHLLAGGAHAPFLKDLLPRAVRPGHHFCLAPLTNAAHVALYFSDYAARQDRGALGALQRAGYQTIYLSSAATAHYGLGGILRRAGFAHVVDGTELAPHPLDGGRVSDYALLTGGLQRALALAGSGPFFLHVHAADTHVPYRVVDPRRFGRHDQARDLGRFLNGIEETDWIFSQLWAALRDLGRATAPLLVISSDHGQAFGEHGYFSHGSAVISQEINVPLLLCHRQLPQRTVRASTHFDVLPTILDLLGVQDRRPGFGDSIFHDDRALAHLLWDGQPSRSTSNCLGLLLGERKHALDLLRETCVDSDWNDGDPRVLCGAERAYFEALLGTLARLRGVQ